ncbi:RNA polymerase sigma factor [Candidatus Parcubacteria bacterium]|nr:RNA polymerase sigma factor [Candidatus Parcubacteria bacterium]
MQYNEKELIEMSQRGNSEAFGRIYDRHVKTIYDFIFYKTRHRETAEDITSQTFFKALKNISSVDADRSILSWLYKIAHNSVLDHYRTTRHQDDIDDCYDLSDDTDVVGELDNAEEVERVKKYLHALTPLERDIVIMRVWQELSYKEIADIIGKTEANSKMIFSRTLKKLRTLMPLAMMLLYIFHTYYGA